MKTTKDALLLIGFLEKVGDAGDKTCQGQSSVQTLKISAFESTRNLDSSFGAPLVEYPKAALH